MQSREGAPEQMDMETTAMEVHAIPKHRHFAGIMLLLGMLFVLPVFVDAQSYGAGTYGGGAYGEGETSQSAASSGGGSSSGGQQLTPKQLEAIYPEIYGGGQVPGCEVGYRFNTLTGKPCPTPTASTTPTVVSASTTYTFTRDLELGISHAQVRTLQQYLNRHGFTIASSGPGSPGNETTIFGTLTRAALIKFQQAKGIKPSVGYFGPLTRKFITTPR